MVERLTQDGEGDCNRVAHWLEYAEAVLGRHNSGRVDDDRHHIAIVVMGEPQLQKTRLGRYGDAYLVGEFEAATPLPVLLLQEDLYHRVQFGALSVVKHAVMGHVCSHEGLPLGGERALSRLGAAMIAKPVEHGRYLLRG